jgi:hypothetical protein
MEDIYDMRNNGIEDRTLIWIDSRQREPSESSSNYTVKLVEDLKNVVGLRVVEATMPATLPTIADHNSGLVVHAVGFDDVLPVSAACVLKVHTASEAGAAWREHTTVDKATKYDRAHDAEHHVAHAVVEVFELTDTDVDIYSLPRAALLQVPVICVAHGDRTIRSLQSSAAYTGGQPGVADTDAKQRLRLSDLSCYDPVANKTVFTCLKDPQKMQRVCDVDITAGVYCLPHGSYSGTRDFLSEMKHDYTPGHAGIRLDFIASTRDRPERSNQIHVDPSLIWTSVTVPGYDHSYMVRKSFFGAVWKGSGAIKVLGMQSNRVGLTTQGGDFVVSDPRERYEGRVRGESPADVGSERYIWLRCAELEQHMVAGVGKVLQRGIGVFRLEKPGDFKEENTEFVSVIPNLFHPIAKLSQLSFRFDMGSRPDVPYDFRDVDHFMLISVTTLRPDRALMYRELPNVLNPSYLPNALTYQAREHTRRNPRPVDTLSADQERRVVELHNTALATNGGVRAYF